MKHRLLVKAKKLACVLRQVKSPCAKISDSKEVKKICSKLFYFCLTYIVMRTTAVPEDWLEVVDKLHRSPMIVHISVQRFCVSLHGVCNLSKMVWDLDAESLRFI